MSRLVGNTLAAVTLGAAFTACGPGEAPQNPEITPAVVNPSATEYCGRLSMLDIYDQPSPDRLTITNTGDCATIYSDKTGQAEAIWKNGQRLVALCLTTPAGVRVQLSKAQEPLKTGYVLFKEQSQSSPSQPIQELVKGHLKPLTDCPKPSNN